MSRPTERETRRWLAALGAAVQDRRAELGLSQETLGYRAGLDRTYVSGIERGRRNPTAVVLLRLARALDLPPSALAALAEARMGSR